MDMADPARLAANEAARALLGASASVEPVTGGGRNSRIWRVHAASGRFALKQYPAQRDDLRDRLGTEVGALRLMKSGAVHEVPQVVASDPQRGFVLMTWIEGTEVDRVTDADIDAAGAFLAAVHALRRDPEAARQPLASEACLSGTEIERQLRTRLAHLRALPPAETECRQFVEDDFAPELDALLARAKERMHAVGLDFAAELPQEGRSLVPADFGFHNALRRADGSLAFIDFEYFGWDDPVKLTADILFHPGVTLAPAQHRRFRSVAERLYGSDERFADRLETLLPLFGLRWVLILLNEFLPERWHRRVLAGAKEDWETAKARQLGKSRALLARVLDSKE
jgi:hypothetical protein